MARRRTSVAIAPPLPPVPSDPLQCRWCGGRRVLATKLDTPEQAMCQSGCQPNTADPAYTRDCSECGCTWKTGRTNGPVLCPRCDGKSLVAQARQERAEGHHIGGFLQSEIQRGASRRAFDANGGE